VRARTVPVPAGPVPDLRHRRVRQLGGYRVLDQRGCRTFSALSSRVRGAATLSCSPPSTTKQRRIRAPQRRCGRHRADGPDRRWWSARSPVLPGRPHVDTNHAPGDRDRDSCADRPARDTQDTARGQKQPDRGTRHQSPRLAGTAPLLAFTALYVLVYAGSHQVRVLRSHERPAPLRRRLSGAVIGIQPLVELILMPLAVFVGRRIGMLRSCARRSLRSRRQHMFRHDRYGRRAVRRSDPHGRRVGIFAALGSCRPELLPTAVPPHPHLHQLHRPKLALGEPPENRSGHRRLPHVFLIPAGLALLAVIGRPS